MKAYPNPRVGPGAGLAHAAGATPPDAAGRCSRLSGAGCLLGVCLCECGFFLLYMYVAGWSDVGPLPAPGSSGRVPLTHRLLCGLHAAAVFQLVCGPLSSGCVQSLPLPSGTVFLLRTDWSKRSGPCCTVLQTAVCAFVCGCCLFLKLAMLQRSRAAMCGERPGPPHTVQAGTLVAAGSCSMLQIARGPMLQACCKPLRS